MTAAADARRLAQLVAHTDPSAAASTLSDSQEAGLPREDVVRQTTLRLFDDDAMAAFIANGYVTLPVSEFGPEFHAAIHERATELFTTQLNYGNTRNIYPVIPELEQVRLSAAPLRSRSFSVLLPMSLTMLCADHARSDRGGSAHLSAWDRLRDGSTQAHAQQL